MNMNRVILGLIIAMGCTGAAVAQVGNTSYGTNALTSDTTGSDNSAFGESALYQNTTDGRNTASGFQALFSNTDGRENTANGDQALKMGQIETRFGLAAF